MLSLWDGARSTFAGPGPPPQLHVAPPPLSPQRRTMCRTRCLRRSRSFSVSLLLIAVVLLSLPVTNGQGVGEGKDMDGAVSRFASASGILYPHVAVADVERAARWAHPPQVQSTDTDALGDENRELLLSASKAHHTNRDEVEWREEASTFSEVHSSWHDETLDTHAAARIRDSIPNQYTPLKRETSEESVALSSAFSESMVLSSSQSDDGLVEEQPLKVYARATLADASPSSYEDPDLAESEMTPSVMSSSLTKPLRWWVVMLLAALGALVLSSVGIFVYCYCQHRANREEEQERADMIQVSVRSMKEQTTELRQKQLQMTMEPVSSPSLRALRDGRKEAVNKPSPHSLSPSSSESAVRAEGNSVTAPFRFCDPREVDKADNQGGALREMEERETVVTVRDTVTKSSRTSSQRYSLTERPHSSHATRMDDTLDADPHNNGERVFLEEEEGDNKEDNGHVGLRRSRRPPTSVALSMQPQHTPAVPTASPCRQDSPGGKDAVHAKGDGANAVNPFQPEQPPSSRKQDLSLFHDSGSTLLVLPPPNPLVAPFTQPVRTLSSLQSAVPPTSSPSKVPKDSLPAAAAESTKPPSMPCAEHAFDTPASVEGNTKAPQPTGPTELPAPPPPIPSSNESVVRCAASERADPNVAAAASCANTTDPLERQKAKAMRTEQPTVSAPADESPFPSSEHTIVSPITDSRPPSQPFSPTSPLAAPAAAAAASNGVDSSASPAVPVSAETNAAPESSSTPQTALALAAAAAPFAAYDESLFRIVHSTPLTLASLPTPHRVDGATESFSLSSHLANRPAREEVATMQVVGAAMLPTATSQQQQQRTDSTDSGSVRPASTEPYASSLLSRSDTVADGEIVAGSICRGPTRDSVGTGESDSRRVSDDNLLAERQDSKDIPPLPSPPLISARRETSRPVFTPQEDPLRVTEKAAPACEGVELKEAASTAPDPFTIAKGHSPEPPQELAPVDQPHQLVQRSSGHSKDADGCHGKEREKRGHHSEQQQPRHSTRSSHGQKHKPRKTLHDRFTIGWPLRRGGGGGEHDSVRPGPSTPQMPFIPLGQPAVSAAPRPSVSLTSRGQFTPSTGTLECLPRTGSLVKTSVEGATHGDAPYPPRAVDWNCEDDGKTAEGHTERDTVPTRDKEETNEEKEQRGCEGIGAPAAGPDTSAKESNARRKGKAAEADDGDDDDDADALQLLNASVTTKVGAELFGLPTGTNTIVARRSAAAAAATAPAPGEVRVCDKAKAVPGGLRSRFLPVSSEQLPRYDEVRQTLLVDYEQIDFTSFVDDEEAE